MRHGRDLVLPEHPAQLLLLELLADPIGKQERTGSLHERPCLVPSRTASPLRSTRTASGSRAQPAPHGPAEHAAYRDEAAAAGGDGVTNVDRAGSSRRERSRLAELRRKRPESARTMGEHGTPQAERWGLLGIEGATPLASPFVGTKGRLA